MTIKTIACPIGMAHSAVPDSAPIWTDAAGNRYRVASGVLDSEDGPTYGLTGHTLATPDAVTVIADLPGLEALAAMGLTPPAAEMA